MYSLFLTENGECVDFFYNLDFICLSIKEMTTNPTQHLYLVRIVCIILYQLTIDDLNSEHRPALYDTCKLSEEHISDAIVIEPKLAVSAVYRERERESDDTKTTTTRYQNDEMCMTQYQT